MFPSTATDWPIESPDRPFLVVSFANCLSVWAADIGTTPHMQTRASKATARLERTESMNHLGEYRTRERPKCGRAKSLARVCGENRPQVKVSFLAVVAQSLTRRPNSNSL